MIDTQPKEIPLKQWVTEESQKAGIGRRGVYNRIYSGFYRLKLRRVNKRVIYVQL